MKYQCLILFLGMVIVQSGVGGAKLTEAAKLRRMLDVIDHRCPALQQKNVQLSGLIDNQTGGFLKQKPVETKPAKILHESMFFTDGNSVTVQQFEVRHQTGLTCGFHAVYNMNRLKYGTWPDDQEFDTTLQKCTNWLKDEGGINNIHGGAVEKLIKKIIGRDKIPQNIVVCDSIDFLQVYLGWRDLLVFAVNRAAITESFWNGTALYFVVNTGASERTLMEGHWLPFKFQRQDDGSILVTTADSMGFDVTHNEVIQDVCTFLLQ